MKKTVVWTEELSKSEVALAGEKACFLSEASKEGANILPSFVVVTDFYNSMLSDIGAELDEILSQMDAGNFNSISESSERIKSLIMNCELSDAKKQEIVDAYKKLTSQQGIDSVDNPALSFLKSNDNLPFVSVRISPTSASCCRSPPILNIKGIDSLIDSIRKIMASVFSVYSIMYREKRGVSYQDFSVAVLIEKMASSSKSGDLFSINPVKNDKAEVYIQAIHGINKGFLNNPNIIIVSKESGELVRRQTQDQKKYITKQGQFGELLVDQLPEKFRNSDILSGSQLSYLCELASKIEQRMNFPQHIEWIVERGQVYVLQTRKLTDVLKRPLKTTSDSNSLNTGLPINPKDVSGVPFVVNSEEDLNGLTSSSVVICKESDDSFLPMFDKIEAILSGSFSLSTHLVRMANDFNITAIIGLKNILSEIQNCSEIKIVGRTGEINLKKQEEIPERPDSSFNMQQPPSQYPEDSDLSDLKQYVLRLEKYITNLVYKEAQKRKEGSGISESEEKKAQILSELEWKVRDLRRKINEV